jgi:hypothetical protein
MIAEKISQELITLAKSNPGKEKEIAKIFSTTLEKYNLVALKDQILKNIYFQKEIIQKSEKALIVVSKMVDAEVILKIVEKITGDKKTPHEVRVDGSVLSGYVAYYQGKKHDASGLRHVNSLNK